MTIRLTTAATAIALLIGASGALGNDKPTDPQIAHIAYTAGLLDIEAAKQAIATSKNKTVVEFAESMLRDHETVNTQALDLVKKLNVTPENNDTSKSLSQAAETKRQELAKLEGAAFDKAYIEQEVAQNAELKSLLETGLKLFRGHQQHAEHVAAELK